MHTELPLASMLFNIALKKNLGTERHEITYYKSSQISGYTEDGDITWIVVMVVKEAFIKPENKAHEMDVIMNRNETKHREIMTKSANTQLLSVIIYDFKKVTRLHSSGHFY